MKSRRSLLRAVERRSEGAVVSPPRRARMGGARARNAWIARRSSIRAAPLRARPASPTTPYARTDERGRAPRGARHATRRSAWSRKPGSASVARPPVPGIMVPGSRASDRRISRTRARTVPSGKVRNPLGGAVCPPSPSRSGPHCMNWPRRGRGALRRVSRTGLPRLDWRRKRPGGPGRAPGARYSRVVVGRTGG